MLGRPRCLPGEQPSELCYIHPRVDHPATKGLHDGGKQELGCISHLPHSQKQQQHDSLSIHKHKSGQSHGWREAAALGELRYKGHTRTFWSGQDPDPDCVCHIRQLQARSILLTENETSKAKSEKEVTEAFLSSFLMRTEFLLKRTALFSCGQFSSLKCLNQELP